MRTAGAVAPASRQRTTMAIDVTAGERRGDGEAHRAPRSDAVRNRARIVEAAWGLLSAREDFDLSMEEVARAADVGKGTLYRHYPTKEGLLQALVYDGAERIISTMQERIPPEADALTKLRTVVALCYDAYETNRISIDLLLRTWRHAERCASDRHDPDHPMTLTIARVRSILEQGVREGVFRPLDLDYTAAVVFSLISPVAFAKQRERLGYSRAALEERVVDLMTHALRNESIIDSR